MPHRRILDKKQFEASNRRRCKMEVPPSGNPSRVEYVRHDVRHRKTLAFQVIGRGSNTPNLDRNAVSAGTATHKCQLGHRLWTTDRGRIGEVEQFRIGPVAEYDDAVRYSFRIAFTRSNGEADVTHYAFCRSSALRPDEHMIGRAQQGAIRCLLRLRVRQRNKQNASDGDQRSAHRYEPS